MPMKGKMDQLAQDLANGKIQIREAEKKEKPKATDERSRLALLMRTHDDQVKLHNRAAQESLALHKHYRSHGEHEMAEIYKKLSNTSLDAAALHKQLQKRYSDRHGSKKK